MNRQPIAIRITREGGGMRIMAVPVTIPEDTRRSAKTQKIEMRADPAEPAEPVLQAPETTPDGPEAFHDEPLPAGGLNAYQQQELEWEQANAAAVPDMMVEVAHQTAPEIIEGDVHGAHGANGVIDVAVQPEKEWVPEPEQKPESEPEQPLVDAAPQTPAIPLPHHDDLPGSEGLYVLCNDQMLGPLSEKEIRCYWAGGRLSGDDLVCELDNEQWRPIRQYFDVPTLVRRMRARR